MHLNLALNGKRVVVRHRMGQKHWIFAVVRLLSRAVIGVWILIYFFVLHVLGCKMDIQCKSMTLDLSYLQSRNLPVTLRSMK